MMVQARRFLRTLAAALPAIALALAIGAGSVRAVQPDEILADPALEARARAIGKELRCLVCQNESIDDSNADLARDLRLLVRARLQAGDSDRQVVDYVVSRYGDFVLLRPPFKPATYALWLGPLAILVLGAAALALYFRRQGRGGAGAPAALSAEDERRLAGLLQDRPE